VHGGVVSEPSYDTTNARDRIQDGEYRLFDGTLVANDLDDLTDGTLNSPIQVDETGTSLEGAFEVSTGTDTDGTNPGVGTCLNWTDNSSATTAQSGRADAMDATWTDNEGLGEELCDVNNRLYCFSN